MSGKLNFFSRLWDNPRSPFKLKLSLIWHCTTEASGFEFHMFISILSVTTSRFPATWGFSHIKPPWCNSPWRYMTNCFTSVLPRRLFRFVTDKLPLSAGGSDSAVPLDDHSWQLIMAHKFCFPRCSQFWQGWMSQQGMEDKWWQILSRTLNILQTDKYNLDFLARYFIFWFV